MIKMPNSTLRVKVGPLHTLPFVTSFSFSGHTFFSKAFSLKDVAQLPQAECSENHRDREKLSICHLSSLSSPANAFL